MTLWTIHHENDFFLTFFSPCLSLLILPFFLSVFSPFLFSRFFRLLSPSSGSFPGSLFFCFITFFTIPSSYLYFLLFSFYSLSFSSFFETIIKTSRKKFLLLLSGFPSLQHCFEIWIRDRNRVSLSFFLLFFLFLTLWERKNWKRVEER